MWEGLSTVGGTSPWLGSVSVGDTSPWLGGICQLWAVPVPGWDLSLWVVPVPGWDPGLYLKENGKTNLHCGCDTVICVKLLLFRFPSHSGLDLGAGS